MNPTRSNSEAPRAQNRAREISGGPNITIQHKHQEATVRFRTYQMSPGRTQAGQNCSRFANPHQPILKQPL